MNFLAKTTNTYNDNNTYSANLTYDTNTTSYINNNIAYKAKHWTYNSNIIITLQHETLERLEWLELSEIL